MSIPRPVRLLTEHGRPIIRRNFRADSCIASTAISIKVLNHFGIQAFPMPAHMAVFNQRYLDMMERLADRPEESITDEEKQYWLEEGAWSLEVEDREVGHVVACTKKLLIDMSIDQATRPAKGIILTPLVLEIKEDFFEGEHAFTQMNDCLLVYQANPRRLDFLRSKDWTEPNRHDRIVSEIITVIDAEIRKKKPR